MAGGTDHNTKDIMLTETHTHIKCTIPWDEYFGMCVSTSNRKNRKLISSRDRVDNSFTKLRIYTYIGSCSIIV